MERSDLEMQTRGKGSPWTRRSYCPGCRSAGYWRTTFTQALADLTAHGPIREERHQG